METKKIKRYKAQVKEISELISDGMRLIADMKCLKAGESMSFFDYDMINRQRTEWRIIREKSRLL